MLKCFKRIFGTIDRQTHGQGVDEKKMRRVFWKAYKSICNPDCFYWQWFAILSSIFKNILDDHDVVLWPSVFCSLYNRPIFFIEIFCVLLLAEYYIAYSTISPGARWGNLRLILHQPEMGVLQLIIMLIWTEIVSGSHQKNTPKWLQFTRLPTTRVLRIQDPSHHSHCHWVSK